MYMALLIRHWGSKWKSDYCVVFGKTCGCIKKFFLIFFSTSYLCIRYVGLSLSYLIGILESHDFWFKLIFFLFFNNFMVLRHIKI